MKKWVLSGLVALLLLLPFRVLAVEEAVSIDLPGASEVSPAIKAYKLIGIPVLPPSSTDVFEVLKGFFGSQADPGVWRLYAYVGGRYVEITGLDQDSVDYGKGWWIISAQAKTLNISGLPFPSFEWSGSMPAGYSILANPFHDTAIVWQDVVDYLSNSPLGLGAYIYKWSDVLGEYVIVTEMLPGESYWTWATQAGYIYVTRGPLGLGAESSGAGDAVRSSQPPPPLPPGAFLKLTSPSKGATLAAGRPTVIRWKSSGISPEGFDPRVDLYLSRNGGKDFTRIASKVKNTGKYRWQVPRKGCNRCVLKVVSVLYPEVSDVSDRPFAIVRDAGR